METIKLHDRPGHPKASCDQEAWVLQAIREVARLSYPSGIKGRIDFARDEAAINQAAVEILEVLGYEPCYENIKRLKVEPPHDCSLHGPGTCK